MPSRGEVGAIDGDPWPRRWHRLLFNRGRLSESNAVARVGDAIQQRWAWREIQILALERDRRYGEGLRKPNFFNDLDFAAETTASELLPILSPLQRPGACRHAIITRQPQKDTRLASRLAAPRLNRSHDAGPLIMPEQREDVRSPADSQGACRPARVRRCGAARGRRRLEGWPRLLR